MSLNAFPWSLGVFSPRIAKLNPPDKPRLALYIEARTHPFHAGGRCRLRKGVRRARISTVQRRS